MLSKRETVQLRSTLCTVPLEGPLRLTSLRFLGQSDLGTTALRVLLLQALTRLLYSLVAVWRTPALQLKQSLVPVLLPWTKSLAKTYSRCFARAGAVVSCKVL